MKTNLRKNIRDFLIGQDAEMVVLNGSRLAKFEGDIKGEIGLDGQTGQSNTTEIRTNPSCCPIEIVNKVYGVFHRRVKGYPNYLKYTWLAGSYKSGRSLAGHIHFGVKEYSIKNSEANQIVANYLGALSLCLEDRKEGIARRSSGTYGFLNDFRKQPHGFETRSLSSWLSSPHVSTAHLALAKTIMFEILNNPSFHPVLRFTDDDFIKVNTAKVKKYFPEIWAEIQKMVLYPKYKQYIDLFKFLIENNLSWFVPNADIKSAWAIADCSIQKSPEFLRLVKHLKDAMASRGFNWSHIFATLKEEDKLKEGYNQIEDLPEDIIANLIPRVEKKPIVKPASPYANMKKNIDIFAGIDQVPELLLDNIIKPSLDNDDDVYEEVNWA